MVRGNNKGKWQRKIKMVRRCSSYVTVVLVLHILCDMCCCPGMFGNNSEIPRAIACVEKL